MLVENAFVSGSLRQAIFRQDGTYNVLDAPGAVPREALPNEIQWFRHAALRVIPADPEGLPVPMEQLQTLLDEEIRFFEGLDGLLVGMDPDMSSNTRRQAISQANEVLESDAAMARRIRRRFFVPADPKQWDPSGGLKLARERQAHSVALCYLTLANGTVDRVIEDINDVVAERFGGGVEAAVNRDALMRSELVAELSRIEAEHDRRAALNLVFQKADFPEVAGISTGNQILMSLQKRIISRMDASSSMPADTATESDRQDIPTATPNDAIINAAEEIADRDLGDIRQRQRLRGGEADIDSITRQIDWIDGDLSRGDAIRAENNLIKLMHRQADESKPGDIIKTLTSVATSAIRKHQHEFAQRVLAAIDVIGTPDAPAMCASAELLRAQGHFENALRVLDNVIEQFPNDVVARNAKAETLRDLGQPKQALEVLDETIRQFPNNEVAQTAKAETLRDLERPGEALEVLRGTIKRFPHNTVARNACGHLLAQVGELEEAEGMLKGPAQRCQTRGDWIAKHILAMAWLRAGRIQKALESLDQGVSSCPFADARAYFRTARPLAKLANHQASEAVAEMEAWESDPVLPLSTEIKLFRAHAYAENGDHVQALKVIEGTNATTSGTKRQERLAHALLKRYGVDAKNASEEHIRAQNQEILNLEIDSLYPLSLAA